MTKDEAALKSFYVISEVSRLLTLAFSKNCDFNYRIQAKMTPGSLPPANEADLPQVTGGYEINIVIHPPADGQ